MKIGTKEFDFSKNTYVMGILNLTPDSFSDGGRWNTLDAACMHVQQMMEEGADVIDVGGESTRPGHEKISDEEEMDRILPVIEALKRRFDVPLSVDTYKSRTAREAIGAGADMVNDIWGLKYDPAMAGVIADSGVCCCLMHNRENLQYQDFVQDVMTDLRQSIGLAQKAGIPEQKILLDPGVGFAKTFEQNLEVVRCLEQFHALGYPMLLGTSRKSLIGTALGLPIDERLEGTLVTTVFAVLAHYAFVRVHDIKENVRAIRMAQAVLHTNIYTDKH